MRRTVIVLWAMLCGTGAASGGPAATVQAPGKTAAGSAGAAPQRAMTVRPLPLPDRTIVRQLEGLWLIDEIPDGGSCLSHWYHANEVEFAFWPTGAQMLIYEHYDLFTPIAIAGIERQGDTLAVQARTRDGALRDLLRIKPLTAGRLEFLSTPGATPSRVIQTGYKCGEPDKSVTAGIRDDRLALIAPSVSGGFSLTAEIAGYSDDDLCQGRIPEEKLHDAAWLQFELHGPDHYWVFGMHWGRFPRFPFKSGGPGHFFDFVRRVEDRGDKGLVLHMQAHLNVQAGGWDVAAARGERYDLTIIPHGNRIEIPEFGTTFVRCSLTDKAGEGMGRP
jgi:hypothetical protein